jgi:hypothetical protein
MRKLTALLAVLMLCLQVFSGTVAFGAEDENFIIEGYDINSDSLSEDDTFLMTIHYNNDSGEVLSNVKIIINNTSSFTGKTTSSISLGSLGAGRGSKELPEIVYKGIGKDLSLTVSYEIGGSVKTEVKTVYVTEAEPEDEDENPSGPVNTAKYVPKLRVGNVNTIPEITAGDSYKLKLTLENYSGYQARNLEISLKMADEAKAPLVLNNFDMNQSVDSIISKTSKEVVFDIKTLKNAPEGLYLLKLNIEYENAYSDHFSASENVYIRIKNKNTSPKIVVDNIAVKSSEASSRAIILELKLKNLGNLKAENVKVTLGGLKSGGFTAYNTTDVRYLNSIGGNGTSAVSYELLMPVSGAVSSNELSVKLEYKDENGTSYTDENQIFVPVGDAEGSGPNIVFEQIVSPQNTVAPGQDFTVSFDLKNNGGASARNVKVTVSADGIVTRSMNPVYLTELKGSDSQKISFRMFTADDAATKNYPIALNVEYEDAAGTKYNASQYVGVFIEGDTTKTVPRIIIDNYSMDPSPVNAGEDFTLKMSFLNTSKTMDVSNIKVTVTSDDGTFTPTDSGNTFYVESIPKTTNIEREIMLHVKPDAEQKSYMLTVDFEYEDEKGNPYTAKETMSVRVLQSPRLVTGDLNMMTETFAGQPISIYLDFYNMGKSTLYNLMVSVEGDFEGQGLSYYVGNFASGSTDFFDAQFTPMNPGQQKGAVLFAFEDANGKKTEIRKEFELNVMEMPQDPMLGENGLPIDGGMMDPGMGMPGEAAKTSIWVYIGIGAGVLIAAVVVFIILRKRHVKRKELSLDE